jgi:hypothetical protein
VFVCAEGADTMAAAQEEMLVGPELALEKQLESYRRMTGEERLAIALRLHELACDLSRDGIRRQFPKASVEEVERHLHQRLRRAHD